MGDQNGNLLTSDDENVTLSVSIGAGQPDSSSALTVAAVNGVVTFNNVIFDTAGTYTLNATTSDSVTMGSAQFAVRAAGASKVVSF